MKKPKHDAKEVKQPLSFRLPYALVGQADEVAALMGGGIDRTNVIQMALEEFMKTGTGAQFLARKKIDQTTRRKPRGNDSAA